VVAAAEIRKRHSDIIKQLKAGGLTTVDVSADGNCFFRAASYVKDGDDARHGQLRCQVASYIESSGSILDGLLDVSPDDGKTFSEHIQAIRTDGEAVGEDAIEALCEICRCEVIIYIAYAEPRVYKPNVDAIRPPIRLAFFEPGHYRAVVGADNSNIRVECQVQNPGNGQSPAQKEIGQSLAPKVNGQSCISMPDQ
jgi:OTU domain-containing protein 3